MVSSGEHNFVRAKIIELVDGIVRVEECEWCHQIRSYSWLQDGSNEVIVFGSSTGEWPLSSFYLRCPPRDPDPALGDEPDKEEDEDIPL